MPNSKRRYILSGLALAGLGAFVARLGTAASEIGLDLRNLHGSVSELQDSVVEISDRSSRVVVRIFVAHGAGDRKYVIECFRYLVRTLDLQYRLQLQVNPGTLPCCRFHCLVDWPDLSLSIDSHVASDRADNDDTAALPRDQVLQYLAQSFYVEAKCPDKHEQPNEREVAFIGDVVIELLEIAELAAVTGSAALASVAPRLRRVCPEHRVYELVHRDLSRF